MAWGKGSWSLRGGGGDVASSTLEDGARGRFSKGGGAASTMTGCLLEGDDFTGLLTASAGLGGGGPMKLGLSLLSG